MRGAEVAWGRIAGFFENELPDTLEDRNHIAYDLVREALEQIFGPENEAWHTYKRPSKEGRIITWVKTGKGDPK